MGMFGFLGRLAFAFLFISSGVQKLQTFEPQSGGPVAENILPYIQKAVADVSTFAQLSIQLDDIKVVTPPEYFPRSRSNRKNFTFTTVQKNSIAATS
jgi:hypothetical protein